MNLVYMWVLVSVGPSREYSIKAIQTPPRNRLSKGKEPNISKEISNTLTTIDRIT